MKITGTRAFKQQVIDVAIVKNLKVVFDSTKMQESFINQKEAHIQKTSLEKTLEENKDHAVNKQENNIESHPAKNKSITLASFGSTPYLNNKDNKESYHATLSNGKTFWGVGLKEAIAESGVKIGDEVLINKVGTKTVKVNVDVKDEQGNVVSVEEKEVERGSWKVDVKNIEVKEVKKVAEPEEPNSKTFDVNYQWLSDENKMGVTVNGKQPDYIPLSILEKIIANDKFLKHYSLEDVKSGKLDLGMVNDIQPVPKQFDEQGEIVQKQEATKAARLKI